MRHDQYTITPRDIHHHAAQLCQRQLRFRGHGPICTALNLLTVLFYAALALFSAWVIGLGVMAYTTAERPVPGNSPAPDSRPE